MKHWTKTLEDKLAEENAQKLYSQLRILGMAKGKESFFGSHPELDAIIQEILDDAFKHGIIPDRKRILNRGESRSRTVTFHRARNLKCKPPKVKRKEKGRSL